MTSCVAYRDGETLQFITSTRQIVCKKTLISSQNFIIVTYLFCSVFGIILLMAKSTSQYVCQQCAARFTRWMGKCEQCGAWNSLLEEIVAATPTFGKSKPVTALKPTVLDDIAVASLPRISSG